ncbi:hypothetical protein [Eisenibacter elegans]|jgi:hypothetical protein|uniref:hypothetical protein n=1 Tax=Eisenibacter elegans TaxID=997 RepID=UPI00047CC35B|nr:hypothetical protein [Eisenibacter elegans]
MKKDIDFPAVTDVYIAVVRSEIQTEEEWLVYLINNSATTLTHTFVAASGYGLSPDTQDQQTTSTLRHHFAEVAAYSATAIERIQPSVFHLQNQYWLSYYIEDKLYDQRFIFYPDSIQVAHLKPLPLMKSLGILAEK